LRINKLNILANGKAFRRNHLVISMHQPVGLEVRGTPRAFPNGAIEEGLCPSSRRKDK